ncbi:MAG: hypothetical protein OFPII_14920 [Osedax symbiont Rs1]|nr:MAG: hypothetical protein OFPII_14920 [Osedax symbiont Rs1]
MISMLLKKSALISFALALSFPANAITDIYEYDDQGKLISITKDGHSKDSYRYDASGKTVYLDRNVVPHSNADNLYLSINIEGSPAVVLISELGNPSLANSELQVTLLNPSSVWTGNYYLISVISPIGTTSFYKKIGINDYTNGKTVINVPTKSLNGTNGQFLTGEFRMTFRVATIAGAVSNFDDELIFNVN